MKPFLLLQLRAEDAAAEEECQSILRCCGLPLSDLEVIRMEKSGVPDLELAKYSGVMVGGGPSNVSDDDEKKPPEQRRFEKELTPLLDEIYEQDFPFLGLCYGIGAIVNHCGGCVSKEKYTESAGAIEIELTNAGKVDPLTKDLPEKFKALAAHKEACIKVPEGFAILARSAACPVQLVRCKENIYAAQFHPELDIDGLASRLRIYRNEGYVPADQVEEIIEEVSSEEIVYPGRIIENFVKIYGQS